MATNACHLAACLALVCQLRGGAQRIPVLSGQRDWNADFSSLRWPKSELTTELKELSMKRDTSPRLSVVDYASCASVPGRVVQVDLFLPGGRAQLPQNLILASFTRDDQNIVVRSTYKLPKDILRMNGSAVHGGRSFKISVPGIGIPFSTDDCLGWSYHGPYGFAFTDKVGATSSFVELLFVSDFTAAMSMKLLEPAPRLGRRYAVRWTAESVLDPFQCWSTRLVSHKREVLRVEQLAAARTQASCCYYAPVTRTYDIPNCFGVGSTEELGLLGGTVWHHPDHCCSDGSLDASILSSVRCSSDAQTPWRQALREVTRCLSASCGSGDRLAADLLAVRRGVGRPRLPRRPVDRARTARGRWRQLKRRQTFQKHSKVEDCAAGAVLLELLESSNDVSGTGGLSLYGSGRYHFGYCALYGYDHAECCLHYACLVFGGTQAKPPAFSQELAKAVEVCTACLYVEVPWGQWSTPQRRVLSHIGRQLAAPSKEPPLPSTLHETVWQLTLLEPPHVDGEQVGALDPRTALILCNMLAQAAVLLEGHTYLYDAIHSIQAALPLSLVSATAVADLLAALPPQDAPSSAGSQRRPAVTPKCATRNALKLAAAAGAALRQQEQTPCSPTASAFLAVLENSGRGEPARRCCPRQVWPALARAAAESGCWPAAVAAVCVICEVAPVWGAVRTAETIDLIHQPSLRTRCQGHSCGALVWQSILDLLVRRAICFSEARGRGEVARSRASASNSPIRVLGYKATFAFLRSGGSFIRMNDGEQLLMNSQYNAPLTRFVDTTYRLQFAALSKCPHLCLGLFRPDDVDAVRAIGPTHAQWWKDNGFRLTQSVIDLGFFDVNRTYCAGHANYRPKFGDEQMSIAEFIANWERVFANRTVLLVSPAAPSLYSRCGNCKAVGDGLLYGRGHRKAPFRLVKRLFTVNPDLLWESHATGDEWVRSINIVRRAWTRARASVAAVIWGPFADVLISELACRGMPAIDIGNLMTLLEGFNAAGSPDMDEIAPDAVTT